MTGPFTKFWMMWNFLQSPQLVWDSVLFYIPKIPVWKLPEGQSEVCLVVFHHCEKCSDQVDIVCWGMFNAQLFAKQCHIFALENIRVPIKNQQHLHKKQHRQQDFPEKDFVRTEQFPHLVTCFRCLRVRRGSIAKRSLSRLKAPTSGWFW